MTIKKQTSTNEIIKCVYCSNPMSEQKKISSENYYYKCYKCKVTIELFKALVDLK